ncbi:hypothetical protein M436DRAFT_80427 [Aureobasidium namibiae CBS 147.97]|uniref:Uncharacterized protein n=1 Tax=Aureobasidium namibiae CBS 147.97 TaxID=1043004 RepID=A0A074XKA1_9PEZI
MAPSQNTRSSGNPLVAPLPASTRASRAVAPVPAAPVPTVPVPAIPVPAAPWGMAALPVEIARMFWEADNEGSKHKELTLTFQPPLVPLANTAPWLPNDHPLHHLSASKPPAGSDDLWLLKGHFPSHVSRHTCYVADETYPFGIIRQNERGLIVRIDISVSDRNRSLRTICSALSTNGDLDQKIHRIEMAGWRSISFSALVYLILECGNYPHLQARIAAGEFHWADGYSVHMKRLAHTLRDDIFQYGTLPEGIDYVPTVAKKVWKYLNPPIDQPVGIPTTALWQWNDRRTIRSWMNTGFFHSHTWQEALQQS